MADLTLTAIIARVRAVVEDDDIGLVPAKLAFTHDQQPSGLLDNTYYVEDGGLVSSRSVGNYKAVRVDRVRIWVARKAAFAGRTTFATIETLLVAIERAIKADGPAQGYHVEVESHRVTQPHGKDLHIGDLAVTVDYDFNEASS